MHGGCCTRIKGTHHKVAVVKLEPLRSPRRPALGARAVLGVLGGLGAKPCTLRDDHSTHTCAHTHQSGFCMPGQGCARQTAPRSPCRRGPCGKRPCGGARQGSRSRHQKEGRRLGAGHRRRGRGRPRDRSAWGFWVRQPAVWRGVNASTLRLIECRACTSMARALAIW